MCRRCSQIKLACLFLLVGWLVCVELSVAGAADEVGRLPKLTVTINGKAVAPKLIHCGEGESVNSFLIDDFDELRHLTKLQMLQISLGSDREFDCSILAQATQLQDLCIYDGDLRNTDALKVLTQVVNLDLSQSQSLVDLWFVKSMRKLKSLDLEYSQVEDLSHLNGLTELRSLNAKVTPLKRLPDRLPGLRDMNVIGTRLSDDAVRDFQQRNPECVVLHGWTRSLQRVLKPTTRLRVRSGGTCHRDESKEQTLFESKNAAEIQQLMTGIQLNESPEGYGGCFCCGSPSLEFYDGNQLIATLGVHHGISLRWDSVWPGDGRLTKQSSEFLINWLADRGIRDPLREVLEAERKRTGN